MKLRRHLMMLALLASLSLHGMDNAGVIKLKKAELSDDIIILAVQKEPADYDTSPEGLIQLKRGGLSEAVIREIVRRAGGSGGSGARSAPSASSPAVPSGGSDNLFSVESPSIAPPFVDPVLGQEYFTRFTLREEGGEYRTTNYGRGILVPINTRVKFVSLDGDTATLRRLDNGKDLKIENVEKFSQKSLQECLRLMLAAQETPIDRLVPSLSNAIRAGQMRKGMTKEQVLMARGYPPGHETPSVDADRWVYWSSKFIHQTIVFQNGRLAEGRQIY